MRAHSWLAVNVTQFISSGRCHMYGAFVRQKIEFQPPTYAITRFSRVLCRDSSSVARMHAR